MTLAWVQIAQPLGLDRWQQMAVLHGAIGRLLMACLLGGLIGLNREVNRKSAGVRTNLLICMGCAFFTLLSAVLAGDANPDKGRVAANIVQGIGFLGAGLILHSRNNRVTGLTSAASVFAVASVGMACGAGLYTTAAAATVIVLMALAAVGFLERRANLKAYSMIYEARGSDSTLILASILDAMDSLHQRLVGFENSAIGEVDRVSFSLTASKRQHQQLHERLRTEPGIASLHTYNDPEED